MALNDGIENDKPAIPGITQSGNRKYVPTLVVQRVLVCKAAPYSISPHVIMLSDEDVCPYCRQPVSTHEKLG